MTYTNKEQALKEYKEAKAQVKENYTPETWKAYCIAKANCMRLGIRI